MSDYSLSRNEAGGATPFAVRLAPNQSLKLYTVTARWDGAAAGGSFLAALSIYSPDGVLVSRTHPSQVFAAGDTGVVTYLPFGGNDTAAAAGAALPAVLMDVSGVGIVGQEFFQTDDTDHVELLNGEASSCFGSAVLDQGGGFWLNVVTVKQTGVYLVQAYATVPVDSASDFVVFLIANVTPLNAGTLPPLDDPSNNPGAIIDYNSRIGTLINTLEGDKVVPTHTLVVRIDDEWGIDPSDPNTYVWLYPIRFGEFFGGGGTHAPATSTVRARLSAVRLTDVT